VCGGGGGYSQQQEDGDCFSPSVQQMGSIATAAASLCGELTHHTLLWQQACQEGGYRMCGAPHSVWMGSHTHPTHTLSFTPACITGEQCAHTPHTHTLVGLVYWLVCPCRHLVISSVFPPVVTLLSPGNTHLTDTDTDTADAHKHKHALISLHKHKHALISLPIGCEGAAAAIDR